MRRSWLSMAVLAALAAIPLAALAQQSAAVQLSDKEAQGRKLFNQSCMVCHTKPQITSGMYGPVLSKETANGDPEVLRGLISDGSPRMPGFKYHFTPAQIDALVAYVKTLPKPATAAGGSSKGDVD